MSTEKQTLPVEKLEPPTPFLEETGKVLLAATTEAFATLEAHATEVINKYAGVVWDKLETGKGMKAAVDARAELRTLRTGVVDKLHAAIKAPLLEVGRLADERKKALGDRLKAAEKEVDDVIKAEEARKAAEKAERERIERERIQAIRERISAIHLLPSHMTGKSAADMRDLLAGLANPADTPADFTDFLDEANAAYANARESAERLIADADAREAEQKRLQQEREQLEREAAELRQQQAALAAQAAASAPAPAQEEAADPAPQADAAAATPTPAMARRPTPRPSNEEIVMLVANHFDVDEATAYSWLVAFSQQKAA